MHADSQVVSVRALEKKEVPGFMRQVDGTLQMLDGKPFGFVVMSESERVYVAPEVLGVSGVSSGAQVAGVAIRCIDRKTGKEGWKVISLSEKARITSNE